MAVGYNIPDPDEPVVVAALLPKVAVPEASPVGAAVAEAVLDRKLELIQEAWHSAYCSVSAAVPFPCGH